MPTRRIPELLAPAGSLDAARAALANGADAVYLGVERFNARDERTQLSMQLLEEVCALARSRGRRVYLTLNTLLKPAELEDALLLLGDAIDRGIHAAIVQDIGGHPAHPAYVPPLRAPWLDADDRDGAQPRVAAVRDLVGSAFTRGHFERAV